MITQEEFLKRVEENSVEYKKQIVSNSFDIMKFHGFDALAGSIGRFALCKKPHDILGAVILGMLPLIKENTGADAIKLVNHTFHTVEIKTSYTDNSKLFKTNTGSVHSTEDINLWQGKVPKSKTRTLKSCFNASYKIVNNLTSKFRDTYFIAADETTDNIIEVYEMDTIAITNHLKSRTIPQSGSVTIKLAEFLRLGKPANSIVTPLGFKDWEKSLLPTLPLKEISYQQNKKLMIAKGSLLVPDLVV